MSVLDVGPVNVRGALHAARARVLWSDGTLVVVHTAKKITRLVSEEPQQTKGATWTAETESGAVTFTRRGCSSCGWRLGRLDRGELLNAG